MTILSGGSQSKAFLARERPSGWAAFDLKYRHQQGSKLELDADPFPPLSGQKTLDSTEQSMNNWSSARPFSQVVHPLLSSGSKIRAPIIYPRKPSNQIAEESSIAHILAKLRLLHDWADESLLKDVLIAVNNDEDQAASLLKEMFTSSSEELENKLPDRSSIVENDPHNVNAEPANEEDSLENQEPDCPDVKLDVRPLFFAPAEPEWEAGDAYSQHRKEAIRMTRSAFQHSKAANNAFLSGDHSSARHFSSSARRERLAAENLNAEAAEEILLMRNRSNDLWKLDLHGLHASEAVRALEERLYSIETAIPSKHSVLSEGLGSQLGTGRSCSVVSTKVPSNKIVRAGNQQASSLSMLSILQVITGTGKHSRGQATLPAAVRSFLIEKGYCFDDVRPGVFAVRPKFRRGPCTGDHITSCILIK